MKAILAVTTALLAAAGTNAAHADPKGVTAVDVAAYKASVETGCRDQGRRLRHAWVEVGRRCKCVVQTLDARLTAEDWKRATDFAQRGKGQDEAKVLAPHMAAVKGCDKHAAGK
jgi:hypothetical protein